MAESTTPSKVKARAQRCGAAQPRTCTSRVRLGLLVVIVGLVAAACTDLFGPRGVATPLLADLAFDDLHSDLKAGGLVYISASPADTAFRLQQAERVPVEITTSSGDRENPGLYRAYCPFTDRGSHYECFRFDIHMLPGSDAWTLAERVAAIGGRFDLVSVTGDLAGVTVFSPDRLVSKARAAGSWPGVYYTELSFPFCVVEPGSACGALQMFLSVPVPIDSGRVIPGDGTLQVRSGDTVTVTYRQPAGQLLQARAVAP